MKKYLLEVCIDSVESAINAEKAGADRFELCGNLIIGGTTPSIELFRAVKKYTNTPINVLIRPRAGDFLYTEYEFEIIKNESELFTKEGANGIVFGCLNADGTIDENRMGELVKIAHSNDKMATMHRAFDMTKDAKEALKVCQKLEIDTILTSGQRNSSKDGQNLLKELMEISKGKPEIMIGAGVDETTPLAYKDVPYARSFHMSGSESIDSKMTYRNPSVNMGLEGFSEYETKRTSIEKIAKMKSALEETFGE